MADPTRRLRIAIIAPVNTSQFNDLLLKAVQPSSSDCAPRSLISLSATGKDLATTTSTLESWSTGQSIGAMPAKFSD